MFFKKLVDYVKKNFYNLKNSKLSHKLSYSKVPISDSSAAILGVVLGSFFVYMFLISLGSGGIDISDLTTLVFYNILLIYLVKSFYRMGNPIQTIKHFFTLICLVIVYLFSLISKLFHFIWNLPTHLLFIYQVFKYNTVWDLVLYFFRSVFKPHLSRILKVFLDLKLVIFVRSGFHRLVIWLKNKLNK